MSELEKVVNEKVKDLQETKIKPKNKVAYCHFGVRRPKGAKYGIFSCLIYSDKYGFNLASRKVMAIELWKDHQYVTYCQSYWFALKCLWEWQGKLYNVGVGRVMLVTDNSVLANWIVKPNKNSKYSGYMHKASKDFAVGGANELILDVGIMKPTENKANKYCREEFIENKEDLRGYKGLINKDTVYKIDLDENQIGDIELNNISGLSEIKEI